MPALKRICVFSGSSLGSAPDYRDAAERLGARLADDGIGLVYGGASVGLMGVVADAVLARGGEVIGVIPDSLADREVAHEGLADLRTVGSMHERKALMADLSDAFVALPGGFGTLDETFEVLTWTQLGFHDKGVGLFNVGGFYDLLVRFLDSLVEAKFVRPPHREMIRVSDDPQTLLRELAAFERPYVEKWVDRT